MNKTFAGLVGIASLVLSSAVQAQAGGYLSAAGGQSDYDLDCAGTASCDNSGSAVRLALGYRFASNWAVEGVYLGLGKARAGINEPGFGLVTGEIKSTGAGLVGVVFLPLGTQWEAAVRLGALSVQTKLSGRLGAGPMFEVESNRKTQLVAGLGLSYRFSPTLSADLVYDSTKIEAADDTANVGAFAVGLTLRF